jgi:hypothetical protein
LESLVSVTWTCVFSQTHWLAFVECNAAFKRM